MKNLNILLVRQYPLQNTKMKAGKAGVTFIESSNCTEQRDELPGNLAAFIRHCFRFTHLRQTDFTTLPIINYSTHIWQHFVKTTLCPLVVDHEYCVVHLHAGDDPGGCGPVRADGGGAAAQQERQPRLRPLRRQGVSHCRQQREDQVGGGQRYPCKASATARRDAEMYSVYALSTCGAISTQRNITVQFQKGCSFQMILLQ